jgi:hypothetical protein
LYDLAKDLLQERNAPTATCARPATLGHLAGDLRLFTAGEVDKLAPADVETVTDFIGGTHEVTLFQAGPSSGEGNGVELAAWRFQTC